MFPLQQNVNLLIIKRLRLLGITYLFVRKISCKLRVKSWL